MKTELETKTKVKMQDVKGMRQYLRTVRRCHKTRLVRASFSLYAWFWFITQALWIKNPEARRPYTFLWRDWIYPHKGIFLMMLGVWYAGTLLWLQWSHYPPAILIALSSWLAAHLIWGGKYIKGQQEWPPYLGEVRND